MNLRRGLIPAQPELSLAMPCYNEEDCLGDTIQPLVDVFHRHEVSLELILVDNGSTDRTGEIIDRYLDQGFPIVKVHLGTNQGYSKGIITGLSQCRAPIIGFLHADGQIAPEDVVRTYRLIHGREERVLVKVRRRFRGDSWRRKLISIVYNLMMQGVFGWLGSIDINGSPKMLSKRNYEAMKCRSEDWFLDPEIILKARGMGLRVIEIDVEGRFRQGGVSHVKGATIAEFFKNIWIYRTGSYLRQWRANVPDRRSLSETTVPDAEAPNRQREATSPTDDPFAGVRIENARRIEDARGYLQKIVSASQHGSHEWHGEVYVSAAHPREAKGNHFHRRMGEWFSVVQGEATVELLEPSSGSTRSIPIGTQTPRSVYVPSGIAHALVNRGRDMMIAVAWAEREHDPGDVYPLVVWPPEGGDRCNASAEDPESSG